MCAYAFFGANHLVLGTDFPFGGSQGVLKTLKSIEDMAIPEIEKEEILEQNARRLLRLPQ